mgnify:CR=1 FL=1|tara:strand:+ start:554 stop:742 length:189 start_codon:yes stop_codon:yes gene_type:complete
MEMKYVMLLWALVSISIIYWDQKSIQNKEKLSLCHNASVKKHYDKYWCTECRLFCEIKKGNK